MVRNALAIETLSKDSFAPFGAIVDWTDDLEAAGAGFHVLVRSEAPTGWRLAILKVTARSVQSMAHHPDTEEMFAPMSGRAVLLVARAGPFAEEGVHAFLLDRPAVVARGVWHATMALSDVATVLIAENLDVTSESVILDRPIGAALA